MKKTHDIRALADRYAKVVEWSPEDKCYIGRVPALSYGGVHGSDRTKVFEEICQVAEEIIAIHMQDGRPLPSATAKKYSGKFLLRISPGLHEALALQSDTTGQSLNTIAETALRRGLAET